MKFKTNLIIAFAAIYSFSCSEEKEAEKSSTPLSAQNLEFEIYDSLVVDYLGNLMLLDISPDKQNFLLMDQSNGEILITDPNGNILHQYNRSGEGPEDYNGGRSGNVVFLTNEEFLIPTTREIIQYDLEGNLIRRLKPEFQGFANLIISFSKAVIKNGDNLYLKIQGRHPDSGDLNTYTNLEKVNINTGEYEPIVPFPKTSKFLVPESEFQAFDYHPTFEVEGDSLYIIFRNEPVLYSYSLNDLSSPAYSKKITFNEFIERNTDAKSDPGSFSIRDFLVGSINNIDKMDDGNFLIYYTSGLTDDEFKEAESNVDGDFNQIFKNADEFNTVGYVIFDGTSVSPIIEKNDLLSTIGKFVSTDEIWFNLNFSEVENDYSVIYKTRLVEE
ncbi:hypothetical protein [Algoriphagus pacificus]|uniref:6-bladed beta-propeller protein n=1 Tax=Algoriphagus pacificus TaxID=2811234 RepID=A0ABS3CN35_9BACT|nr:hypothetical protein [Algoriphagus pacificus]MBN7817856.1 hypothetical protein [Algoriphagus pacificus]